MNGEQVIYVLLLLFNAFALIHLAAIRRAKPPSDITTAVKANVYQEMQTTLEDDDRRNIEMQKEWQRFRWEPYPSKIEWKEN